MALQPSDEQQYIIDLIDKGNNVVGDCVAGSGKTTTVLLLARVFPNRHILQVTYNSQLKSEVREKADALGVENLTIHTFHSLCRAYYTTYGYDDEMLKRVIRKNTPPRCEIPPFSIVVLDEVQDMSLLLYRFIKKCTDDISVPFQLLILGDRCQGIYEFKGTDTRFLTMASFVWNRPFISTSLTTSYRLTHPIASFLNKIMLGEERIHTVRDGPPVQYIRCDCWAIHKKIADIIEDLVDTRSQRSISPGDIFILAGSVKSDETPIKRLENELVMRRIPCFFPSSDDAVIDETMIKDKIVFSTIHQSKGRERRVVLLYGFDTSYFMFFGRDMNPTICPNTLYVAATRAKEQLIVLDDFSNYPLPFLTHTYAEMKKLPYMSVQEIFINNRIHFSPKKLEKTINLYHETTVTELIRFQGDIDIDDLFTVEKEAYYQVDLPHKIRIGDRYEGVSDINGLVIPAIYESIHWMPRIEQYTRSVLEEKRPKHKYVLDYAEKYLSDKMETIEDFVRLGLIYLSLRDGIYNKLAQIKDVKWLTHDMVEKCHQTMKRYFGNSNVEYEKKVTREYSFTIPIHIRGFIDAIKGKTVYEMKCVETLTYDHKLQLVVYAWLCSGQDMEFKLVNIRTGEMLSLLHKKERIEEVMAQLILQKYGSRARLSDEEFLHRLV